MDIVTHAIIGMATSAGVMPTHPELACGLVLGNVAPDLDAFSRLGGKHAFLRFHQTYTHSLAAVTFPIIVGAVFWMLGSPIWANLAFGVAIGMFMHVALDLTNSYGVRCLWPFTSKRFALDWIFFIDAPIVCLTIVALAFQWLVGSELGWLRAISLSYVGLLAIVVFARGLIALRARQMLRGSTIEQSQTALIPTSCSPFHFLVCLQDSDRLNLFCFSVLTGSRTQVEVVEILDRIAPPAITESLEYSIMKSLSPYYHVVQQVSSEGLLAFVCRDMRIRNFNTKFGTLTCQVGPDGQIMAKQWEV